MKAGNDIRGYGWVARFLHWTIAILILAAVGFGLYATSLPHETPAEVETSFRIFSLHKTIGMAVLILVVIRILWSSGQPKPAPLHPWRKLETGLAEVIHWALYVGMLIMPLSGWFMHAATPGAFSRIVWPLGQRLPFIPESAELSERFAAFHELGWWVLAGLVALHVAGALKHVLIDRDATLARMAGNTQTLPEPPAQDPRHSNLPFAIGGIVIWAAVVAFASFAPAERAAVPGATTTQAPATAAGQQGSWVVDSGTLGITVQQGASPVQGSFADWNAAIEFDPETREGKVDVTINTGSLTLGAISDNAKGPEFLNSAAFPEAHLSGQILPGEGDNAQTVKGELTIAGQSVPVEMPFTLTLNGDQAQAAGGVVIDRRDFGVGKSYADESTVGFSVDIKFDLTATRK